jgi:hypothetical protein
MDDFAALESARLHCFLALLKEAREDKKGAFQSWRAAANTSDDDVEEKVCFAPSASEVRPER